MPAGASLATIDHFRDLASRGRLRVRLWVMIGEPNEVLARRLPDYRIIGHADHHLTVRSIKRFIDGALGAHGAWLLEPYNDLPDSRGLQLNSLDVLRETARLAAEHNIQLCTHALGHLAGREGRIASEQDVDRDAGQIDHLDLQLVVPGPELPQPDPDLLDLVSVDRDPERLRGWVGR